MNREFCGTSEGFREARQLRKMSGFQVGCTIVVSDFLSTNQGLLNGSPVRSKTPVSYRGLPEPGEELFRQKECSYILGRTPSV